MTFFGILFVILVILSLCLCKDIFSPSKIYLAVVFVFFGESLFSNNNDQYYQVIILIIYFFALLIILTEKLGFYIKSRNILYLERISNTIVLRIWMLTLIPVITQLFFIAQMGGVEGYLISIGSRVYSWRGFGIYLMLIRLISVISYLYFIKIITSKYHKRDLIIFILHFSVFITLSLMSGSRSMLLWNIVYMVVIYHYVRNNINIFKALMAFSCVVIMAMVLGTIRDGYNVTDGDFSSGINLQEKILNSSNFTYGTKPIQLLLNLDGAYDYKLGQTYLTVFTNLIPRNLWESKPDPGGIIFTRDILGDPFGGFSYYSTGIFGEAFINFGLLVGVFFAVIQLFMLYLCNLLCILRLNKISDGVKFGKAISYYPFILFGIPAYLYAEFTTNTLSLMFFKITLFFIICKIVNFRMV